MSITRSPRRLCVILMAGALALAACGGGDSADPVDIPTADQSDEQSTETDTDTDTDTETDTDAPEGETLSAADGAAARADRAQFAGGGNASAESVAADDMSIAPCGDIEPYVPTAEEIATSNATTDQLAAVLDRYGVAYTIESDDLGFRYVATDSADVVAQSVVDSFWSSQVPEPEPIDPVELERIRAEIDAVAAALDAAGLTYTKGADETGYEWIDWDYEDEAAAAVVNAVYAELYPPPAPTAEEIAMFTEENARLTAAFDEAGIAYEVKRDVLGWEWVEWDYDDESIWPVTEAIFAELYPVDPAVCPEVSVDPAVEETAVEETVVEETVVDETVDVIVADEFTPDQVAQRDAEVAGLAEGFAATGVEHEVIGESPWASVMFDIDAEAAVGVVQGVIAART